MSVLRQFLSRREAEINEQMKLLEAELAEIKAARDALQKSVVFESDKPQERQPPLTIKGMIRSILRGRKDGLTANEILMEIRVRFGVRIERTSLSPQLSRLRDSDEVILKNGRWHSAQFALPNLTMSGGAHEEKP